MTNNNSISFPGGFSVLMAVYRGDDSSQFDLAVNSVFLNSLLPNKFVIVVDGEVPKDIDLVLQKYQNKYQALTIVRAPQNLGLASALNLGLSVIESAWVVRADADDINHKDRFYKLALHIKHNPTIQVLSSAIREVDLDGRFLSIKEVPLSDREIRKYIKYRSPFNHMAVAYQRRIILDVEGYDNFYLKEDYALWAKVIAYGAVCGNCTDVLVDARTGVAMLKRRGGLRYVVSEFMLQKQLVHYGINSIYAAFFFGSLRIMIFSFPYFIRGFIYSNFLRR